MAKYRKNPVSVDAFRFGYDPVPSEMMGDDRIHIRFDPDFHMIINTLEGDMRADFGDYIIKGIKGELYPCKPDIFEATYSSDEILVKADAGNHNVMESDPVKNPLHYTKDDVECKQAQAAMIRNSYPDHCTATALKYLWRWQDKGGIEDLKKAAEYLQFAVDYIEDPYAFIHGHPKCDECPFCNASPSDEDCENDTPPVEDPESNASPNEDSHKPDTCNMVRDAEKWLFNDKWITCSACGAQMHNFTGDTCPFCDRKVRYVIDHPDTLAVRNVLDKIQSWG